MCSQYNKLLGLYFIWPPSFVISSNLLSTNYQLSKDTMTYLDIYSRHCGRLSEKITPLNRKVGLMLHLNFNYTKCIKSDPLAASHSLLHARPRGDTQHIRIRGGHSKEISGNLKISLQLHCSPKISAHFILRYLCMNRKYPEIMQIEVRIASGEPRIISSTMFGVKKHHEHSFSFIWTQKYRTYLPVCACAECPPPGMRVIRTCYIW